MSAMPSTIVKPSCFRAAMRAARADQEVHMKANGEPYPGQISVAKARQRQMNVASVGAGGGARMSTMRSAVRR